MSKPLERVRAVCLSLPETFEQEAWGEPTFRVKKRVFAMFANNHHHDGHVAVWLPAPVGTQAYLVDSEPEKFCVPPYVGGKGWIGVEVARVSDEELRQLVVQAYCMIAPAKLQALVSD